MSRMGYRILAEFTMVVHFGYLAYVPLGGYLAWRWLHAFWPHLAAVTWGYATILAGLNCPLTYVEDWARERAGQPGLPPGGFIDHYIEGVVYPERYTVLVQAWAAAAVVTSWLGVLVRRRLRRREVASGDGPTRRAGASGGSVRLS